MPGARAGRGSFISSAVGGGWIVGAGLAVWATVTAGAASSKAAEASKSFFISIPSQFWRFVARNNRGHPELCPAGTRRNLAETQVHLLLARSANRGRWP